MTAKTKLYIRTAIFFLVISSPAVFFVVLGFLKDDPKPEPLSVRPKVPLNLVVKVTDVAAAPDDSTVKYLSNKNEVVNAASRGVAALAEKVLAYAAYQVVRDGRAGCDLNMTIAVKVTPLAANYEFTGRQYTGANIQGDLVLANSQGQIVGRRTFEGECLPPKEIAREGRRIGPEDAPFSKSFAAPGGGVEALFDLLAETVGPDVAVAALFHNEKHNDDYWYNILPSAKAVAVRYGAATASKLQGALHYQGYSLQSWFNITDAIAQIDDRGAVEAMSATLKDSSEYSNRRLRHVAIGAICKHPHARFADLLLDVFQNHEDSEVYMPASGVLCQLRDPRAVELSIRLLKSDQALRRKSAAYVLGEFRDLRAVEPLLAALKSDESPVVRGFAAEALGRIHDPRAVEPLIAALNPAPSECGDKIADALGEFRDRRAAQPLLRLLAADQALTNDEKARLHSAVANALLKISDRATIQSAVDVEIARMADRNNNMLIIENAAKILRELTGESYIRAEQWQEWWAKNKATFQEKRKPKQVDG